MRIALVLRGHFRTFEKTQDSWKSALDGCDYDCFFHTWDKEDCDTPTWYRRNIQESSKLSSEQIKIIKDWDQNLLIEEQTFSSTDINTIYASHSPHKVLEYRIDSLLNTLKRINKNNYDIIVVGRYDLKLYNIKFKDINIKNNEICIGARIADSLFGGVAVNAELFAFNAIDKDKLSNPLSGANPLKYTNAEEWYSELYHNAFDNVNHIWNYKSDFDMIRK